MRFNPFSRLTTLTLLLSFTALPLLAQQTPLKLDDGSKEKRLELPPELEKALRARDAIENSQRQEIQSNAEKKAKDNIGLSSNNSRKSTLRDENKEKEKQKDLEAKRDKAVSEETGLRPSLNEQNRAQRNPRNDQQRQNRDFGQGPSEDNRQREALANEQLPRATRQIDINKGTPTPSITSPNQGPSIELTRSPNMATLANPRTGKQSKAALQKQQDKTNSTSAKEKNFVQMPKINQASQSRQILRSELALIQRNSRYAPLPRAIPAKPSATPMIVERQDSRGRILPNANPLAVGSITHPVSGLVIPRTIQKTAEVDLIGVFTKDMSALRAPTLEGELYQPLGVKSGAFTLMPTLDIAAGFDSNFGRNATQQGAFLTTFTPELSVNSDFARHAVNAEIKGSFSLFDVNQSMHRPELSTKVGLRLDIKRDQRLDLNVHTRMAGQGTLPSSYTLADDVRVNGEPLAFTQGAGATYTKDFNRLIFSLKGSFDRTTYDDVGLSDNSIIQGVERNFNAVKGAFRVAVRVLEDFKPFVEVFSEQRMFDVPLRGTVDQGSVTSGAKLGVRFERPKSIMGELAIGTVTRNNRDALQADINGMLIDGTLVWMPTGLTNVTFNAKTAFDESVLTGVSSVYRREIGVQIDHALRRYLIASAKFTFGNEIYQGTARNDNRFNLTTALTYKLSRSVAVRGEYRFEKLVSHGSTTAVDYTANMLLVGLRLTR